MKITSVLILPVISIILALSTCVSIFSNDSANDLASSVPTECISSPFGIIPENNNPEESEPLPATAPPQSPTPELLTSDGMTSINITIGSVTFLAKLYDNDAANAFLALFPLTLNMSELNGNEKYCYLPGNFLTDSKQVGNISSGDLMLYGSDCLVVFYESFATSYRYTKLGYIEDVSGLADALGHGNVDVAFAISD